MPSTYTQNLGIELPATGEQANTWGVTVNRNMDTLDTAINGNIPLTAPPAGTPYQLTINNGADSPVAANPVIIWGGAQSQQGTVQIDYQSSRKHLYFMRNQTTGGFGIAFAQGNGSVFNLQAGYDAIIYADGGGQGANVACALSSPQFVNLLVSGNAQVNGTLQVTGTINGINLTPDAQGNLKFTGGLGLGNPTAIPDVLTVNGLGTGGQLRLVYSNYGVILRNDASQFYIGVTAANNPYGAVAAWPFQMNLASGNIGMGTWGPDGSRTLNAPSIHTGSLAADTFISAGTTISAGAGINVTGGRSLFSSGDPYQVGLQYGSAVNYIGSNPAGQFQVSNSGGAAILVVDSSGNLTANGLIHSLSGGIMFPNGTVQATAATGFAATPHQAQRSTNTAYTNTTGLTMIVVASMGMFANTSAAAYVGAGSPSTEVAQVSNFGTSTSQTVPLVFIVPPGWVYQVNYSSTAPVGIWVEYY